MAKSWKGTREILPLMQNVITSYRHPVGGQNRPASTAAGPRNTVGGKVPGHDQWIEVMSERETAGLDLWTGEPLDDINKK